MSDDLNELDQLLNDPCLTDERIEEIIRDADKLARELAGNDAEYKCSIFEYACSFKLDRERDKLNERRDNRYHKERLEALKVKEKENK